MNKIDLGSMSRSDMEAYVRSIGEPAFRAGQIRAWLCRGVDFADMTDLSLPLRQKLSDTCYSGLPKIEKKLVSGIDGTIKYLFSFPDGESVESVVMFYRHGTTICISSQAGCRMGCRFCASTLGGRARDLTPSEMLGQIAAAGRDAGVRIDGVVMMGIGEPLDNYENTLSFLRLVTSPDGMNIGARHISLSTSGLADKIRALAKENLQITLSISLHAATDEKRSALMPVNQKWPLDALLSAARDYFAATGRRISMEYTLIPGKNDAPEDAKALAALLRRYFSKGDALHVNLIPLNAVAERGFAPGSRVQALKFQKTMEQLGVAATVRRTLGPDINASCGQLRRGQTVHTEETI